MIKCNMIERNDTIVCSDVRETDNHRRISVVYQKTFGGIRREDCSTFAVW